jgi:hypothetical protein
MRYLSLFDDFSQIDESYSFDSDSLFEAKMNQMTDLKENCMASWDFEDFKDFFNPYVNESVSDEDRGILMEKAYYTYELGVLYEHNKEWFSGSDNIYYLEDNSNDVPRAILFKNNRLHIISGETLNKLKEGLDLILNEGWLSDVGNFLGKVKDKAVGAFNKYVKEPVKKAAAWVGDKAKKVWNAVSSGAKAVWEFAKKIASAVAAFVKEDPMNAIAIGLMIISGIISFIPAAGTVIGPVLMVIAGVIQLYTGGRDLVKASKEVGTAEKVSDIVKGGTKIVFGSASLLLGIKDIVASAAAALPGMGATGVAIKASVTTWATNFGKTAFGAPASKGVGAALGCSAWIAEFFSTLCLNAPFMKKFVEVAADGTKTIKPQWLSVGTKGANAGYAKGVDAATSKETTADKVKSGLDKVAKDTQKKMKQNASLDSDYSSGSLNEAEGGGWGFGELVINFLAYIGRACFSWLYKAITGALSGIGKLINGIMDLPSRITKGIDSFREKYKSSFIGGILSGALSTFVKPFSFVAGKLIDGYIKPIVKPITGWMIGLGKKDEAIAAKIKASPILSKPPVPGVKDPGKVTIAAKKVEITAKDKAAIKKLGTKGVATMVKAGGGTEKMLEKIKKAQGEFKKKFPGVAKEKGSWGSSPSGKATYTIKSKEADGSVTLFNDGKYTVISGPNKKLRGEFKADKGVKLKEPEDGWKKNESRRYVLSIDNFLG